MAELNIQLPDSLLNRANRIVKREKLSLNELLLNSISNELIRYETSHFFADRAQGFNEADFLAALKEIPATEPDAIDRIE